VKILDDRENNHMVSSDEIPASKTKYLRWAGLICIALLLFYGISPYFSFWRFAVALRSGDTAAINAYVDFPEIRQSLKRQLLARFSRVSTGHKRLSQLGPSLIDMIVDAYATPDGLAALLANPKGLSDLRAPQIIATGKGVDLSKVKLAFFTGPRTFVVDRDGIKLRFRFRHLRWRLDDLDLGLGGPQT
jgi:Protein of unknown function (DUF2939)